MSKSSKMYLMYIMLTVAYYAQKRYYCNISVNCLWISSQWQSFKTFFYEYIQLALLQTKLSKLSYYCYFTITTDSNMFKNIFLSATICIAILSMIPLVRWMIMLFVKAILSS